MLLIPDQILEKIVLGIDKEGNEGPWLINFFIFHFKNGMSKKAS